MKKKDTKARMQIIFGALILALFFSVELYMMINYSEKYLIIAGIALIELIFLYVIIQGIFALKDEKEIRNEEQYDNVFKSEKASYLMLKKYFEEFEDKLNYLEKASKIPTEEIINAQKGIAKVIMNRNREGSEAMISTTEQITEQLTEMQKQSEALQSLLASCKDEIIVSQKAAGDSSEIGTDANSGSGGSDEGYGTSIKYSTFAESENDSAVSSSFICHCAGTSFGARASWNTETNCRTGASSSV